MKEVSRTDALIRQFLLGQLDGEDLERFENLFLTDSSTRERALASEQELIDDYLDDNLSQDEKERFLSRFAQTDEQRLQLRINGAIKDWAVKEVAVSEAEVKPPVFSRAQSWFHFSPRVVVPITVTIVIAVVLGTVWLSRRTEQRKLLAVEQELASLNSAASLRETPSEMTSYELKPVSVRGVESQAGLIVPAGMGIVELNLPWIQNERYSAYQAEIRRVGDSESYTIPNLEAENNGGYTIRLRVPAQMLSKGQYKIDLTGVAANGLTSFSEEYLFAVGN